MNEAQKKRFQRRLTSICKNYNKFDSWKQFESRADRLIEDIYDEGWSDAIAHEPAGGGKG